MSKINQVQTAIRQLSGGAYQKLMDVYLYKRFGFDNITPLGSHTGTDKTTKGTPDSYVRLNNGKFILIAYGSVSEEPYEKIEKDILACLNSSKTGIDVSDIEQIICCHTSTNLSPGQYKQLYSHFPNTLVIGMGDLSIDLLLKYPSIAKDHLFIAIDTNQIFDIKDFIEFASNNPFSTSLDMPLLCRERELEELLALVEKNDVVMLCGKSGIGKTRLALEVAERYASKNYSSIKVIKSNNEPIYDDLQATFTDDKNFIVIVDDANQLSQLGHLLNLCVSPKRQHKIKILLTVRDYAKKSLIRNIRNIITPEIYPLRALSDDNIEKITIKNLGINNYFVIQQIKQIAKGSIRLAVMAGACASKGMFEHIKNAYDIFDVYFNDIITSLNREDIITAALIALFDSFELRTDSMLSTAISKPSFLAMKNQHIWQYK
ncbi:MAG: hypothetical protein GX207_03760 [Peptococcaceae bacterium]|nr:hypothetical protein [Peptococcaceae bacterium]